MKGISTHAEAAKAIRAELKVQFPNVKFKVRSDSFAGGNSVDIYWIDGPNIAQVDEIVRKFKYGKFNSWNDMYEDNNRNFNLPQVKYVMTHREISFNTAVKVVEKIKKETGFEITISPKENNGYKIENLYTEVFEAFRGRYNGDPIRGYATEMTF
ncbi:MAG: hypothetical protein HPY53_01675 [Brevinematales bacterium]|nr:hypothetical protein [Brevinematales bacterium]